MNSIKELKGIKIALLLALMLLIIVPNISGALSVSSIITDNTTTFCNSIIPATTKLTSGNALSNGVFTLSLGLMGLMFAIIAFTYALGYALGITPLVNFAKTEIGEIAITLVILIIMLGTVAFVTGNNSPGRIFSSYDIHGVFSNDCASLVSSAFTMSVNFRSITITQDMYSLVSSTTVKLAPDYFGFEFAPFGGLTVLNQIIKIMMSFTGLLIALFFGIAVFLAIIYGLFPIFLYVGIVLRTIPWTRAAGGAFLGLFIGFYILLPFLMAFVSTVPFMVPTATSLPSFSFSEISGFNILGVIKSFGNLIEGNLLIGFVEGVVGPSLYIIIGTVISIILSLDFAETMGDYLGAPSLTSSKALKGVV